MKWLEPSYLIRLAAQVARAVPITVVRWLQAHLVRIRLERLMNATVAITDPVTAMVVAVLNFLSTPAGQTLVTELNTVIVDLINFAHGKTQAPAATSK